jgi:hypothetical protein
MTTSPFTKTITAQFETVGRRQKLVGQLGEIRDESGLLIHSQSYDSTIEAEQALDDLVYELLVDYAERGLVDALPVARCATCGGDGDCPDCDPDAHFGALELAEAHRLDELEAERDAIEADGDSYGAFESSVAEATTWQSTPESSSPLTTAQSLAQLLATNMQTPTYVVAQDGSYLVQDDADLAAYYDGRATIVATYAPLAVTRQSQAIDAKLTTCGYCRGIHHIQKCPILHHAVFAEHWTGADLGRGLCQLLWRNHAAFVQLIAEAHPARLIEYAESYIAFIRDNRPESTLTTHEVLSRWLPLVNGRGPAGAAARAA